MSRSHIITDKIIDKGLIRPGQTVIIGLSGGPDSLCLLHALNSIADMYELDLVPVHVNHRLRAEADSEADHVADICDRMGLECRIYESSCSELSEELGVSTEEAGRQLRYRVFDEVADDLTYEGADPANIVIALAHNADDQAETVLFRLLRGTGPHGLAGIPAVRFSAGGYLIVRPLLEIERKDIEAYIKENKLRPNIDKSNGENTYTRNRIRNELIPYLEENYNPRIKDNLRRYAMLADMDDSLLRDIAFAEYSDHITISEEEERAVIDLTGLAENPPSVNSRIVSLVMELLGLESSATYENVSAVVDLMYSEHPSAGIDLPLGIRAYREYDKLIFSGREEIIAADASIALYPKVLPAREFDPDEDEAYAAFDFDKFNAEHPGRIGDIVLRTRQEGDFLPMKSGSKKIQDLLVDSKVRKTARDSVLMAAIGSEILWVLPSSQFSSEREQKKGKFSQKYQISKGTERVLLIELGESI